MHISGTVLLRGMYGCVWYLCSMLLTSDMTGFSLDAFLLLARVALAEARVLRVARVLLLLLDESSSSSCELLQRWLKYYRT